VNDALAGIDPALPAKVVNRRPAAVFGFFKNFHPSGPVRFPGPDLPASLNCILHLRQAPVESVIRENHHMGYEWVLIAVTFGLATGIIGRAKAAPSSSGSWSARCCRSSAYRLHPDAQRDQRAERRCPTIATTS
jgi:hypothetical protein